MRERDIFIEALEKGPPAEIAAYLDAACAGDDDLRRRVERLLAEHRRQDSFLLDAPPPTVDVEPGAPTVDLNGTVVGPYKLLQRIGEGGMGVVYLAEQSGPVRRQVALKLIKPGMDSRQVIARFEAERQALALMDHANIAKVFDAGATDAGRPYFVMELVKGVPITRYCDEARLTTRQRLALFVEVASAVQHAHQKGVIHRDLKPGNVLVALYDGRAVPKVIDFGVAKATGASLTDRTLFSGFGGVIGTLEYMSPEQAELNQLDIDTRSDVYSLGVLLYELLTGSTPLEARRFKEAALLEILRVIRQEEPPKPSTRLSTTEHLPSIAACRGVEPRKLSGLMRGELDWIVMKALEKDRARRYESPSFLAADVRRYLDDEPVLACPPSAAYRLRKFVRRHRGPVIAAALVALALVGGIVGTTWGLLGAQKARQDEVKRADGERLAKLDAQGQRALAELSGKQAERGRARAREALDMMSSWVIDNWLFRQAKLMPDQKAFLQAALERYEEFTRESGDTPEQRQALAQAYGRVARIRQILGLHREARAAWDRCTELFAALHRDHPRVPDYAAGLAAAYTDSAVVQIQLKENEQALRSFELARGLLESLLAEHPRVPDYTASLIATLNQIGVVHLALGRYEGAMRSYQAARELAQRLYDEHPDTLDHARDLAATLHNIAMALGEHGLKEQALKADEAALALRSRVVKQGGSDHKDVHALAHSHNNIGVLQADLHRFTDALKSYRTASENYARLVKVLPGVPGYGQDLARSFSNIGIVEMQLGELSEALKSNEAARALQQLLVDSDPEVPDYMADLARTYYRRALIEDKRRKPAEARKALDAARAIQEPLVEAHGSTHLYVVDLGGMYVNTGNLVSGGGDNQAALEWYRKGIEVLEPVSRVEPPLADALGNLRNALWGRALVLIQLGEHATALADLQRTVALEGGRTGSTLVVRAQTLARLGDHARAAADLEKLAAWSDVPAVFSYEVARAYAVCAAAAARDERLAAPERGTTMETYAALAVKALGQAMHAGFKNVGQVGRETDFDPLRLREDFKRLLSEPEAVKE